MPQPSHARLQSHFLPLLYRVERHARITFRHVRCPHRREDLVAEAVALAWQWLLRLRRRGKDAYAFPSVIATLAARATHAGRKLAGMTRSKDVFNALAQRRQGFTVGSLPAFSTLGTTPLAEALRDNTSTPPDEQARFRIDFPAWLGSLAPRDHNLAIDMARGERTTDLARGYGLSPARVSQKRREFHAGWEAFCGDPSAGMGPAWQS